MNDLEPQVLSVRGTHDQVAIELCVPRTLRYFHGHFASHPILPGVVQLAWASALGLEHLQVGPNLECIQKLKFSRIIQPAARLSLALEWSAPHRCLSFIYTENGAPCSSGRFVYTA